MKAIYLVRHAIAADLGGPHTTDESRPLTDEGIRRFGLQVRGLSALEVSIDTVLTSPLLRCRQTAQLLADGLGVRSAVDVLDALRPGGRIADVLDSLGAHRHADAVALVGHEPSIGAVAAALIGAPGSIPFKRGAVCRVDVASFPPRGAGVLAWFLTPKMMRKMAGAG
jgi:phosphohistidine phosphatase